MTSLRMVGFCAVIAIAASIASSAPPDIPPTTDQPALLEYLVKQNEAAAQRVRSFSYVVDEEQHSTLNGQPLVQHERLRVIRATDGRGRLDASAKVPVEDRSGKIIVWEQNDELYMLNQTGGTYLRLNPQPIAATYDFESLGSIPNSIAESLRIPSMERFELSGFQVYDSTLRRMTSIKSSNLAVEAHPRAGGAGEYWIVFTSKSDHARSQELVINADHDFLIERWTSFTDGQPGTEHLIRTGQIKLEGGKSVWLPVVVEKKFRGNKVGTSSFVATIKYESVNKDFDDGVFEFSSLPIPEGTPVSHKRIDGQSDESYMHDGRLISVEEASKLGLPEMHLRAITEHSEELYGKSSVHRTTQPATGQTSNAKRLQSAAVGSSAVSTRTSRWILWTGVPLVAIAGITIYWRKRVAAVAMILLAFASASRAAEPPPITDQPALLEYLLQQNENTATSLHSFKFVQEMEFRQPTAPTEQQDEFMTVKVLRTDDGRAAFESESDPAAYDVASGKFLGKQHSTHRSVIDHTFGAALEINNGDPQTYVCDFDSVNSIPRTAASRLYNGDDHRYELYGFGIGQSLRERTAGLKNSNIVVETRRGSSGQNSYVIALTLKRNNQRYLEITINPEHDFLSERLQHYQNGRPSMDITVAPTQIKTDDGKNIWLPTTVHEIFYRRSNRDPNQQRPDDDLIDRETIVKLRYEGVNFKPHDGDFKLEALRIPEASPVFRMLPDGKLDAQYLHGGKLISQEEHNTITYVRSLEKSAATQPALAAKVQAMLHPGNPPRSHLWIWLSTSAVVVIAIGIVWRRAVRAA